MTYGSKGKLDYYAEGKDARRAGAPVTNNPYPRKLGVPWEFWRRGWSEALTQTQTRRTKGEARAAQTGGPLNPREKVSGR